MLRCLECGREMPPGMRICPYCGTVHCAGCGQKLLPSVDACPICGKSVKPPAEKQGIPLGEVIALVMILWFFTGMLLPGGFPFMKILLIISSFAVGAILMRREYPGPLPVTTLVLILANVVIFAALVMAGIVEQAISGYGLRPAVILRGENLLSLLTSFFMHADWAHLSGNMMALFIMGYALEGRIGGARFLAFYMLAGLTVSAVDLAVRPGSMIPAIGASGAISGMLGACFIWAQRTKAPLFFLLSMLLPIATLIALARPSPLTFGVSIGVYLLILMFMILALFDPKYRITWYAFPFLAVWIIVQVLLAALVGLRTGTHYWAHVAGFSAGMGWWLLLKKREDNVQINVIKSLRIAEFDGNVCARAISKKVMRQEFYCLKTSFNQECQLRFASNKQYNLFRPYSGLFPRTPYCL